MERAADTTYTTADLSATIVAYFKAHVVLRCTFKVYVAYFIQGVWVTWAARCAPTTCGCTCLHVEGFPISLCRLRKTFLALGAKQTRLGKDMSSTYNAPHRQRHVRRFILALDMALKDPPRRPRLR